MWGFQRKTTALAHESPTSKTRELREHYCFEGETAAGIQILLKEEGKEVDVDPGEQVGPGLQRAPLLLSRVPGPCK